MKWLVWLVLAGFSGRELAGRALKPAAIDRYCEQLKLEFRETTPYLFAGPDPWVELDEMPSVFSDQVLASVYAEGAGIRRVVLRLFGPKNDWDQTVDYCFARDGSLLKRTRYLEQKTANIAFEETAYYADGRTRKERVRHHALGSGREDRSQFNDPGAPDYPTVTDLPFPEDFDSWRRLAHFDLKPFKTLRELSQCA